MISEGFPFGAQKLNKHTGMFETILLVFYSSTLEKTHHSEFGIPIGI